MTVPGQRGGGYAQTEMLARRKDQFGWEAVVNAAKQTASENRRLPSALRAAVDCAVCCALRDALYPPYYKLERRRSADTENSQPLASVVTD